MNRELPDVQAGFRKGRGTRDQSANICWIMEKPREFQKNIYFFFIDYAKAFDCVDHNKIWKILKTQQWPQDWKRSVFIWTSKKNNAKECSNYCTTALISHTSKVTLKILQARLQQYVNRELPDVQVGFRKARGTRYQIANICSIIKKNMRIPEKHLFLLYWLCQSLWLCGLQQTVENSERDGNTRPPNLPPEKSVCRSRSNS